MQLDWNPPDFSNFPVKGFLYTADYAASVHDGSDNAYGREWAIAALLETNFPQLMIEGLAGRELTRENLLNAWDRVRIEFIEVLDRMMEDERWAWPNETERRNGDVAGLIRDIIDTGELQDSLETFQDYSG